MGELVEFPKLQASPEMLEELVKKTHELSRTSENVYYDSPHVKERMQQRKVTNMQLFDVLRQGKGIDGPIVGKYGDWIIKLKRYSAGRVVQVVVAVKNDHLEVVTVI